MNRLLAGISCALFLALSTHAFAENQPVVIHKNSIIDLVYLGASDCPPCRAWKVFDLPKLAATPQYQHIRFTEVKKWIPDPVPAAKDLPEHLSPMRAELVRVINRNRGSPMFALLVDGKAIAGGWGTSTYHQLLPSLEELVNRKLAATD